MIEEGFLPIGGEAVLKRHETYGKNALRPMCCVAMPFGKRTPPGKKKPLIDFDEIYG
jgi:hypothetical protein